MNDRYKDARERWRVEADEDWRGWADKIPAIPMPAGWKVKVVPPFSGALARFLVTNTAGEEKSVYLDVWERLGVWSGPYWEVYPVADDVARCDMDAVDELVRLIEAPGGSGS